MSQLKQNWKVLTLTVLSCAAVVSAWSFLNIAALPTLQLEDPPAVVVLTDVDRGRIDSVLEGIDLTHGDMVALNPSAQQAQDLMTAVRDWWDLNGSTWSQLQDDVTRSRTVVRNLAQLPRLGPVDEGSSDALTAARGALAAARDAVDQHQDALRTELTGLMSPSQQSTWASIQRGWGRDMPMRMLDLTGEQRQAYGKALRYHRLSAAAASTDDERVAVEAAWQDTLAGILTPENQQVIDAYAAYAQDASTAVGDAMADAFATSEG